MTPEETERARRDRREKEYQDLKSRVERQWPIRQKLARMTGRKPGDLTIIELFAAVLIVSPEQTDAARKIILDGGGL